MANNFLEEVLYFFLETAQSFVLALVIFIAGYYLIGRPHIISGSSMDPSFANTEFIITQKVSYYLHQPQRGDVIVFKWPPNPNFEYIKRIVALPDDTLKIEDGAITINNQKLNEPYLDPRTYTAGNIAFEAGKDYKIPKDQYLVMGDNRGKSSDSREWGLVPKKNLIGKVFFRYWPLTHIGFIKHYSF